MASLYSATVDGIALAAATAKTCMELQTPSTKRIKLVQWWVEFDGITASNVPVKVEFQAASANITTGTTYTADAVEPADPAALTVVKHTATVEGAGTLSRGEIHRVPPTSGFVMVYPLGREWIVAASSAWRIRLTAANIVNATVGIIWEE